MGTPKAAVTGLYPDIPKTIIPPEVQSTAPLTLSISSNCQFSNFVHAPPP